MRNVVITGNSVSNVSHYSAARLRRAPEEEQKNTEEIKVLQETNVFQMIQRIQLSSDQPTPSHLFLVID